MIEPRNTNFLIDCSARRALSGQTPKLLRAYSFFINVKGSEVLLRAHFSSPPSEDDLELISVIETEILADLWDSYEISTDVEIVSGNGALSFLPGGIAYLRDGEAETINPS